ncbi:MAG: sodium:glutamate symporter [Lentisphaerae bacterium]|nr:sodium:glutamate symporter [Lentisphaerota bacterium]MCP4102036.1 sodium:glutamate symporter [Lentisphaerota bacterium]
MSAVASFCGLCLLLVIGKFLRVKIPILQRLYLPSSVVGGVVGLIILTVFKKYIPTVWYEGWNDLPGFLINIVFAGLFLGAFIPGIKKIWNIAAPQLCYGQIVAWGQYMVGIGLVIVLLGPLMGVPDQLGVIIPVGFEGGHGTAGGLIPVFKELGWSEGGDLGLASATVGMVSAIVIGMWLINWAVKKGYVQNVRTFDKQTPHERCGIYPVEEQPRAGRQTVFSDSIDSLALHMSMVGIAILIGYIFKLGLEELNIYAPKSVQSLGILTSFPLFPLCMIGGLILQLFLNRVKIGHIVNHGQMQRISGAALDFLVVAAVASIRIELIVQNWLPFVLLVLVGILWNVFCVLWLADRLLPESWFEQSIAQMGQSMGVTATGLMLLRTVDPDSETIAPAAFGYKQLLHEPFMGGGLWTSIAIPLVIKTGGHVVFLISLGAITFWLIFWKLFLSQGRRFFNPTRG